MRRFYAAAGVLFLILAPFRLAWVTYQDLTHPEVWDHDVTRDPRVYLPLVAAELLILAVLLWLGSRPAAGTAGTPADGNARHPSPTEENRCGGRS